MDEENELINDSIFNLKQLGLNATENDWNTFYNNVKEIDSKKLSFINQIDLHYTLGAYFIRKKEYKLAKENYLKAIKLYQPIFSNFSNLNSYLNANLELGKIYSQEKKLDKAEKYFDCTIPLFIDNLNQIHKKHYYLYQFKKIDKFLFQDLIENKITLNTFRNFNDPFDCLIFHWFEYDKMQQTNSMHFQQMTNSFYKIRVGCFVGNFEIDEKFAKNTLMWSHYAEAHKGICILYKISKDLFEQYSNKEQSEILNIAKVNYSPDLIFKEDISVVNCFLSKQNAWEYENEVRLLYFNPNNKQDFVRLDMGSNVEIEQIYFGYKCCEQDKKTIKQLFPSICKDAKINYAKDKDIYSSIEFIDSE